MTSFKGHTYPSRLNDRLWVLGHYHFHCYLIRGDRQTALIEMGVSATADTVLRQLGNLGVSPDYLIVTHPHGDHVNGLPALRAAFPTATVMAGPGALAFMDHPKTGPSLIWDDAYMTRFLESEGLINNRPSLSTAPSLAGAIVQTEGTVTDLGGISLAFHEAKGHAPGHLAVRIPEIDTLIVSDALGFYYPDTRFFPIFFTGFADYMATLDRLEGMNARIVTPAHQAVFQGVEVREAFALARQNAQDLKDRLVQDGRDDEAIVRDLFDECYRDELRLYPAENIMGCCRLLLRRSREA